MEEKITINEKLTKFFSSECTLTGLMSDINEASKVLFDAVSKTNGTATAIDALCLLSSTAKLLDVLSEDF